MIDCGKHTAAEVVTKMHAALEGRELLQAMHEVGYFEGRPPDPEELD